MKKNKAQWILIALFFILSLSALYIVLAKLQRPSSDSNQVHYIIKKINIPARKNANATTLHVEIAQKGSASKSNILFLLPGGPGADHSADVKRSGELVDVATLVYIDARGCGESAKSTNPKKDYTLENYIKDIEEIRNQLGFKKINVLGTSYGGIAAMGYALQYPANIKKLILVSTAPSYRFLADAKRKLKAIGSKEQIKIAQKLWSGTFANEAEVHKFFVLFTPLYSITTSKTEAEKSILNFKPGVFSYESPGVFSYESLNIGFGGFLRTFNYEPQLSRINCPTLILAGDQDWITDAKYPKLMAKKLKYSILKI